MELVCPAGNSIAAKKAIENGADAIYVGVNNKTNARYFNGLNFSESSLAETAKWVRDRNKKIFLAVNTFPQPDGWSHWQRAVDLAADLAFDAIIVADQGVLAYAAERHPNLNRHLSVQASATNHEALDFYQRYYGIKRAVLPRVLAMHQVAKLASRTTVELEVFGFGSLCIMAEGRCYLSSYLTGDSPNNCGACSPAHAVRWVEKEGSLETRLNKVLIDRFAPGESAGYPTLCKGRFRANDQVFHVLEEPTSLNAMDVLPELMAANIVALKIEGRQRSPAYVGKVANVWRAAIDAAERNPQDFKPLPAWYKTLASLSEGAQTTLGAYARPWQ